jgi:Spherulation-specific family 4
MTKHFLSAVVFDVSAQVPTQTAGDNSTKAASTAYVDTAVAGVSGGAWAAGTVSTLGTGLALVSGDLHVDTDVIPAWADISTSISEISDTASAAKATAIAVQTATTPFPRQTGLIIPFYEYIASPLSNTDLGGLLTLIRVHPTVPVIVIVNQSGSEGTGGPGPYDAAMEQTIRMLRAAGATIAGYVATGGGARASAAVTADIDSWQSLYPTTPPDAIFFDQMPTDTGDGDVNLSTYNSYYLYAHQHNYKLVVGNWGTAATSAWYAATVADIYCIYENSSWPSPATFDVAPYPFTSGAITDYPVRQFAALVHDSSWDQSSYTALQPYFRWIYATDGTGGNPWGAPSSYLETLFLVCAAQDQLWKAGEIRDIGSSLSITDGIMDVNLDGVSVGGFTVANWVAVGANDATGTVFYSLNTAAGALRLIQFKTAGNTRWIIACSDDAESGSNVGSNLVINRYDDAGAYLSQPLNIDRATGIVGLSNGVNIQGTSTIDNATIGGISPAPGSFTTLTATDIAIGSGSGPRWTSGTGAPGGTEPLGSLYSRTDGGVGTTLYVSRGDGTWNAVAGV